jgi:predicted chitinase
LIELGLTYIIIYDPNPTHEHESLSLIETNLKYSILGLGVTNKDKILTSSYSTCLVAPSPILWGKIVAL